MTTRRMIMGSIVGAGMSALGIKKTFNSDVPTARSEQALDCPECGVEPIPQFPFLTIVKSVKTQQRFITLVLSRDELSKFTDEQIKDMAYRMAEYGNTRLAMFGLVQTNSDGSVTYQAQKGDSGETVEVTF